MRPDVRAGMTGGAATREYGDHDRRTEKEMFPAHLRLDCPARRAGPCRAPSEAVRMRTTLAAAVALSLLALGGCSAAGNGVAAPSDCTASVNARLGTLIAERHDGPVDNVMVCGTTIGPSRPQRAGPHGGHQLIPVRVPLAGGSAALIEVVTNDDLDGRVTAPRGATVFAYGQYFLTSSRQRPFVAGIHDVHCATHRGADNGWVIVNGAKFPQRPCSR